MRKPIQKPSERVAERLMAAATRAFSSKWGPLPRPVPMRVEKPAEPIFSKPADVAVNAGAAQPTAQQVAAIEQLVLDTVRQTLAQDKIAALCVTRNRAVIAAGAALAGFDVINARAVSAPVAGDAA